MPSAIPCCLSPLTSRIHSCLFSDCRRTVSSKFFDTQVPSISTEELVLSRLRCNGHSLLLSSYFSSIGRIENPSCSACEHPCQDTSHSAVQLRTLWRLSVSLRSRPWRVSRLLGLHGLPPCPHSLEGFG